MSAIEEMSVKTWLLFLYIAAVLLYGVVAAAIDPAFYSIKIEFSFYCIGWALIAFRTFQDGKSGFPAYLIPFNLSWELYAVRGYSSLTTGWVPLSAKIYFLMWLLLSMVHLWGISRFSRKEFTLKLSAKWFWPLMLALMGCLLVYYSHFVQTRGEVEFYSILGELAVPIISVNFMIMLFLREDLVGISVWGNLARIAGQYSTLINRSHDEYSPWFPLCLFAVTLISDCLFLYRLYRLDRKTKAFGLSVFSRI